MLNSTHSITRRPYFLNMSVDRAEMNRRLFKALKPGGHLVVPDHSAKTGTGTSAAKSLHRIDEKVVVGEFRQAGFQLEQEGDFLKNPANSLLKFSPKQVHRNKGEALMEEAN